MDIPNYGKIDAKTIVFDMNGTLATDGKVKDDVKNLLQKLSEKYRIVVLTADTFGTIKEEFKNLNVHIEIIDNTNEKYESSKKYSPYIGIGNGNNDVEMLKSSELGICVIGKEGASVEALLASKIVVKDVKDAINLFLNEKRLIATLRK
jgi:soluble P-type ATPase